MPRVSVILCSYNQRAYLAEAVESVLGQTYQDYELLVLDNGSTDGSQELLARYEGDPRVRLFLHRENAPVSRRMNEGVREARGELISFLYSDDMYLPTKLERQVARFASLGPEWGVVYAYVEGLNQKTGRRWRFPSIAAEGDVFADLLARHDRGPVDMLTPLTRRACFERFPFYEDIFAEGEAVFFRLAQVYKFAFVPEALAVYRDTGENRGKALVRNAEMVFDLLGRLERGPDLTPDKARAVDEFRRQYNRRLGWQAVRLDGDMGWARRRFHDALRLSWRNVFHPYVLLGYPLSLAPTPLRKAINRAGFAVRKKPETLAIRDSYGGSAP
ncbi:MAG TPA: glycosyltransferase, partial [Polyangiaceae bacterium]|nr:glycosyltransferase [Polyangiaceae bacterium]